MMICVPIRKKSFDSFKKDFIEAQMHADIVEIRFDDMTCGIEDFKEILRLKKKPIIYKVTNGKNLEKAGKQKIDFFDVDFETGSKEIKLIKERNPESKIIISSHDFKKTPSLEELQKKLKKMKKMNVDIIKIATMAKTMKDSLTMLHFLDKNSKKNKIIGICMGEHGKITRVAGHLFGNYLMYAPLRDKEKTADGQINIHKLKQIQCLLK